MQYFYSQEQWVNFATLKDFECSFFHCITLYIQSGTIWTDFKPQVENLNKEKLTIIAWDPPGYGKSRPPNKTFPENFFRRDATWACNLMKTLGFNKFSLIGWSDGGITSLILAAVYPENVQKVIVIGANAYITPGEMEIYQSKLKIFEYMS